MLEILTEKAPFHDALISNADWINRCLEVGKFPLISPNLAGGDIIRKCWFQEYSNAEDCLDDLKAVEQQFS